MSEHYRLYHYPICPFSRQVRFLFAHKDISFIPVIENFWEKREKFCLMNPTGEVPFLAIKRPDDSMEQVKNLLIFSSEAITSYIEDQYPSDSLIFGNIDHKTEIRKMIHWINVKFYSEVSKHIIGERIYSWFKYQKNPDLQLLKLARINLHKHLAFFENLLTKRDHIGGMEFSIADVALAAHISSLDYLGEINWQNYNILKDWYTIIKSKPAFRDLLYDMIPGFKPSTWYRELDF